MGWMKYLFIFLVILFGADLVLNMLGNILTKAESVLGRASSMPLF